MGGIKGGMSVFRHYFKKDPHEGAELHSGDQRLHLVIFSKDRPCQLASLLESLQDHMRWPLASIHVLFKSTSPDFEAGYALARRESPIRDIHWQKEGSFRSDLLSLLERMEGRDLIMFLVDDDIVFRSVDLAPVMKHFRADHLFISLRVSSAYEPLQGWMPCFKQEDGFLMWEWRFHRRKSNAWNYPFSLDGNIYHLDRIRSIISSVDFKAPNSLEAAMHAYRHVPWVKRIRTGLACVPPCVVNNPLNRVQTEGETAHKNIDPAWINACYLRGQRIDNRQLYVQNPGHTHWDLGLPLTPLAEALF